MTSNTHAKLISAFAFVLFAAMFFSMSCTQPVLPDSRRAGGNAGQPELPSPLGSIVNGDFLMIADGRSRSGDWLQRARKDYLTAFFAAYAQESRLTSRFFPRDSQLAISGLAGGRVPLSGVYEGSGEIRGYFRRLFRTVEIRDAQLQYQLAEGDFVSSHVRILAYIPTSRAEIDLETVFVFRFGSCGFIREARMYYDTQAWTRAFGNEAGGRVYTDTRNPEDDYIVSAGETPVAELVDGLYDLFYAGEIPAVLELLSDDAAVYFKGDPATYPFAGVYRGTAEILNFVGNLAGTAVPVEVDRFMISEGDRCDMVLFEKWSVFHTGKTYQVHTVNSWQIDSEGKLLGFSNFPDSLEISLAYIQ
jgi:ketosteroid isomerase-like protein